MTPVTFGHGAPSAARDRNYPLSWHGAGLFVVVACVLMAWSPGLLPGMSALVSHHAGDLDAIYLQTRAGGANLGTPLDDPAPSWQWEPLDVVATQAFRGNEWPLWQPYNGFGSPHLATLDSSVFSPTKLVLYLGLTTNRTWVYVLQVLLAGAFTYAVGASWGWHPAACASCALAFSLSNYVTEFRNYPQAVSATWLPAALWAAHRVATARPGGIPTLGIILGTLVLSGHPEASLAMIAASGTFGLATAYEADGWRALRHRDVWPAMRLAASAGAGVATSMVVLLPFATELGNAVSHIHAKPVASIFDPRLITSMTTLLASVILPVPEATAWFDQRVWHGAFVGPLALIMMLVLPRVRASVLAPVGALLVLVMTISLLTPPHGLLRAAIYFESYYAVATGTWVVAGIAGEALHALLTGGPTSPSHLINHARCALVWVAVAGVLLTLIAVNDFGSGPLLHLTSGAVLAWSVLPVAAAGASLASRPDGPRRRLGALLSAIASATWLVAWTAYRVDAVPRTDLSPPAPITAAAEQSDPLARVTGLDATTLQGNSAANWVMHDPKLSGAFHSCRYLGFMARASDPPEPGTCAALSDSINVTLFGATPRGTQLAGIATVLYPPTRTPEFPAPPLDASLAYADSFVAVARIDRTLPRAYLVRRARTCAEPISDAIDAIFAPDFDPFHEVLLEPWLPPGDGDGPSGPAGDWRARCPASQLGAPKGDDGLVRVWPATYRHVSVTFDLNLDTPAWLILLDRNAPGWTATIDGKASPIAVANALFRAVRLESGPQHVSFNYRPDGFGVGLTATLIMLGTEAVALAACLAQSCRARNITEAIAVATGLGLVAAQSWAILGFMPR